MIGEEEEEDLLEETGPPTILSTILKAVKDESASVRLAALQILVKSECPAGLHPFCRALGDDDDNVQVAAAGALQEAVRRGHGQLVVDRLLSTATRSPSTQVREACLRSVIQDEFVGEERVIEGLRAMTSFGEASIRRLAVLGLGRGGDMDAASKAIDDPDVTVRSAAAHVACEARGIVITTEGLGMRPKPRVLDANKAAQVTAILLRALEDKEDDLRGLAAKALSTEQDGFHVHTHSTISRIRAELSRVQST